MSKRLIISEEERNEIRGKYNLINEGEASSIIDNLETFGFKTCQLPQALIPFVKKGGYKNYTCYSNKKAVFIYIDNNTLIGASPDNIKGKKYNIDTAYDVLQQFK